MREIKFRGKRIDNGEWAYGYYAVHKMMLTGEMDYFIIVDEQRPQSITPETVGQYTGQKDKNDKEIYEGDIVSAREQSNKAPFKGYVHYLNAQYWVNYIGYESYYLPLIQLHNAIYEPIEVIGNIYENGDRISVSNDR